MRFVLLLTVLGLLSACGGATGEGAGASAKSASAAGSDDDPGFAEYAATHGIATLDHPEAAPEVTSDGLRLEVIDHGKPIKQDGVLNEWPPLAKATTVVEGTSKSTLGISLQYDEAKLYIGADVTDAAFAAGHDHVLVTLAVPKPGGSGAYTTYDIGLFAGKPGESEGSVRYGDRAHIPGAKIVEAPTESGYTFEATIPLAALPELRSTRVGLHGRAAYVESGAVIATGPGDAQRPGAMAWVPSDPELAMIEQLLAPKGLTKIAPAADIVADLTGDGRRERIAVFEHYLTICGASYLGGTGFFYRDLVGELVKLEVRDVSGRGRGDVVVRRRQSSGDGTREYLEVLSAPSNTEEPRLTFAHEVGIRQSDRHVDNAVRMSRGEIEVSVEPPSGWDASSYTEPIATDVEPLLLPWGSVRTQMYRFDGTRFARTKHITQQPTAPAPSSPGAVAAEERGDDSTRSIAQHPPEPATPTVTRGGDLSAQVLEQYRHDRGGGAAAPKVDLQVQVAGDERPERVLLLGRDIVVFGPGYKGGSGYTFLTLQPFANAGDIHDLSARDLTGDGAADLVVRGVRRVPAGKSSVEVELMVVYEVTEDAITRLFAIETGREQHGKRIQGLVQFIPAAGGKKFDILAAPGRAVGWSARTYPWAQEKPGEGSYEPLLLPWGGISSVRYSYDGSQFTKAE